MNGGTITGNTYYGVHVDDGATFTMVNGTIGDNDEDQGVEVYHAGFTLKGGVITDIIHLNSSVITIGAVLGDTARYRVEMQGEAGTFTSGLFGQGIRGKLCQR